MTLERETTCPACRHTSGIVRECFNESDFFSRFAIEHNPNTAKSTLSALSGTSIDIIECSNCHMEYAYPLVAGDVHFYEAAYKYMPKAGLRWEYDQFFQDRQNIKTLIDIGCGDGAFVNLAVKKGIDAVGIDFNPGNVNEKISSRFQAVNIPQLDDYLASIISTSFNAYCAWQVLEHLEDPRRFLSSIRRHAKVGARLFIAVPSDISFLSRRSAHPITNYPPHHLTRWNRRSLEIIGNECGWKIVKHAYEPLGMGSLRLYGSRLLRSMKKEGIEKHLFRFAQSGRFMNSAFWPRYDFETPSTAVKGLSILAAMALWPTSIGLSGQSQYVIYSPA